jgi:hypothetical protein
MCWRNLSLLLIKCTRRGASIHYSEYKQDSGQQYLLKSLHTHIHMREFEIYLTSTSFQPLKVNSVPLVRTDRATAVYRRSYGKLLRIQGLTWWGQRIPTAVNLDFLDPKPLLIHSSSSSFILPRLSGPRSRPSTSKKNLVALGIEPGIFNL